MLLYVDNLDFNGNNVSQLSNLKYKETKTMMILSAEGIYKCQENSLKKVKIIDVPTKKSYIGDIPITCDESKYEIKDTCFQIPRNHVVENINSSHYRLRQQALVDLVVETRHIADNHTKPITSIHFLVKDNIISHGVKEDVISFLSLLKYK